MSSASGIRAGKAFVQLSADRTPLIRDLKLAGKDLKAWGASALSIGKQVAAAGLALGSALGGAAAIFAKMGSDLVDMSGRTGASVEALSTLGFAASATGASMEDVEKGMRMVAKSGRFAGMSTDQAFRSALAAVAAVDDPMEQARLAMELFGKSGTSLIPMSEDLAALEARARSLGLEMSTRDAQAADALGDAWGELVAVGQMLAVKVGAVLAPALQGAVNWITEIIAVGGQWLAKNQEIIQQTIRIATSWDVLWNSIKMAWLEGTTWLESNWIEFTNSIVQWADSVANGVIDTFVDMYMRAVRLALKARDFIMEQTGGQVMGDMVIDVMTAAIGAGMKTIGKGVAHDFAAGMDEETQARLAKMRKDLEEQRKALDDAVAKAAAPPAEEPAAKALAAVAEPEDLAAAQRKLTSVGTFSAGAASGLANDAKMDKLVSTSAATAKHTKKIADAAGAGIPVD